jgi:NAD(P)-dependent dehydrogenase (short-subunit alcohol dehydrogenase family)
MLKFNPFSLEGKTVLVTGASSGIGKGIAITCSKMGARVILNGRDIKRLQKTYSLLMGTDNFVVNGDLTNNGILSKMVEQVPNLDGVVHCAGIGQRVLCKDVKADDISKIMEVNFNAPVMLQAELLRQKKINRGASIIFISSIASWSPSYGNSVYSASKGAIISYAKCLALELAPQKIRVNCISPAMIWTNLILRDGIDEDLLKEDEKTYPLKRYGTPEDIAYLAIYMLSNASEWMTSSNVEITGGGTLS